MSLHCANPEAERFILPKRRVISYILIYGGYHLENSWENNVQRNKSHFTRVKGSQKPQPPLPFLSSKVLVAISEIFQIPRVSFEMLMYLHCILHSDLSRPEFARYFSSRCSPCYWVLYIIFCLCWIFEQISFRFFDPLLQFSALSTLPL